MSNLFHSSDSTNSKCDMKRNQAGFSCRWCERWWHLWWPTAAKDKKKRYAPGQRSGNELFTWCIHTFDHDVPPETPKQREYQTTKCWHHSVMSCSDNSWPCSGLKGPCSKRQTSCSPTQARVTSSRATLLTPTPVLYALHTLEHSQELIPLFSRVRHPHAQVARSRHEPDVCMVCVCATVWWACYNQKCLQTARKRLQYIVFSLSHASWKETNFVSILSPLSNQRSVSKVVLQNMMTHLAALIFSWGVCDQLRRLFFSLFAFLTYHLCCC